jgi:hypothetical protein
MRCKTCGTVLVLRAKDYCVKHRQERDVVRQRVQYHARKARQTASGAILRRYAPRDRGDYPTPVIEAKMARAWAQIQQARKQAA